MEEQCIGEGNKVLATIQTFAGMLSDVQKQGALHGMKTNPASERKIQFLIKSVCIKRVAGSLFV